MPKPGYTQSPEHKKKRLSQIEGDGNGSYKDGRRSYRRKAGAKENDGTVVHHKNGDRTNNSASNLERLTDGKCKPGRRTTSMHERHHGGRHGDSIATAIAMLRYDRGCGKGRVGTGHGSCKQAKLAQVTPFSHRTSAQVEAAKREKLIIQAAKVAAGIGVTGGLTALVMNKESGANPYYDPMPEVKSKPAAPKEEAKPDIKPVDSPVLKPALSTRAEIEESLRSLSRKPRKEVEPKDKGVSAEVRKPSTEKPKTLTKEEKRQRRELIKGLLPSKTTDMPSDPGNMTVSDPVNNVPVWGTFEGSKARQVASENQGKLSSPSGRPKKITKKKEEGWGKYGVKIASPKEKEAWKRYRSKNRGAYRLRLSAADMKKYEENRDSIYIPLTIALMREDTLCDKRYGWTRGAGGKCVRSKKVNTANLSQMGISLPGASKAKKAKVAGYGAAALIAIGSAPFAVSHAKNRFNAALDFVNSDKFNKQSDDFTKQIDSSSLPPFLKEKAKGLVGQSKAFVAGAILKRDLNASLVEINKEHNFSTWAIDGGKGGFTSVFSSGNNILMFESIYDEDYLDPEYDDETGEEIKEGVYEMSFKINGDFDKKGDMSKEEAGKIIKASKAIMNDHLDRIPDGSMIVASCWDGDGKGKQRALAYIRQGFAVRDQDDSEIKLWGIKREGKQGRRITPPGEVQLDSLVVTNKRVRNARVLLSSVKPFAKNNC